MKGDPLSQSRGSGITRNLVTCATLQDMPDRFARVVSDVYTGACLRWARSGFVPEALLFYDENLHRTRVMISARPRDLPESERERLDSVAHPIEFVTHPLFGRNLRSQVEEASAVALIYVGQQPVDDSGHVSVLVSAAWPSRVFVETRAGIVESYRHQGVLIPDPQRLAVEKWLTDLIPGRPEPGPEPKHKGGTDTL